MEELQKLMDNLGEWSDKQFGTDRPVTAQIHHLKKEINELLLAPFDDYEYADCLLLLLDAYRKRGGNVKQLIYFSRKKFNIAKQRKYNKPDINGVVEHLRE